MLNLEAGIPMWVENEYSDLRTLLSYALRFCKDQRWTLEKYRSASAFLFHSYLISLLVGLVTCICVELIRIRSNMFFHCMLPFLLILLSNLTAWPLFPDELTISKSLPILSHWSDLLFHVCILHMNFLVFEFLFSACLLSVIYLRFARSGNLRSVSVTRFMPPTLMSWDCLPRRPIVLQVLTPSSPLSTVRLRVLIPYRYHWNRHGREKSVAVRS